MKLFDPFKCPPPDPATVPTHRLEYSFTNSLRINIAHMFGKLPLDDVFVVLIPSTSTRYNITRYSLQNYGDGQAFSSGKLLSTDYARIDPDINTSCFRFPVPYSGIIVLIA